MSRVEGAEELRKNILKLKARQRRQIRKGLIVAGLLIKKKSQKMTPVRLGNLRSSGYIVSTSGETGESGQFEGEGDSIVDIIGNHETVVAGSIAAVKARTQKGVSTVAVGYTAPYALNVHENPKSGTSGWTPLSEQYKTVVIQSGPKKGQPRTAGDFHSEVGGWKFLEKAINSSHEEIERAIAAAAKLPSGPVRS